MRRDGEPLRSPDSGWEIPNLMSGLPSCVLNGQTISLFVICSDHYSGHLARHVKTNKGATIVDNFQFDSQLARIIVGLDEFAAADPSVAARASKTCSTDPVFFDYRNLTYFKFVNIQLYFSLARFFLFFMIEPSRRQQSPIVGSFGQPGRGFQCPAFRRAF